MSAVAHFYIAKFTDGTIKVGYSTDPAGRLAAHSRTAASFGISIEMSWVSPPHLANHARINEERLIDYCAARAPVRRQREYFAGVDFAELRDFAAAQHMPTADLGVEDRTELMAS